MKKQRHRWQPVWTRWLWLFLCIPLLASCNNTLLQDTGAESRDLETRVMEGDSAAARCIDAIGAALSNAGFQPYSISVIQAAAEKSVTDQNLTQSLDLTRIIPEIACAAELATLDSKAGLTEGDDRAAAIVAIAAGTTLSLAGLVNDPENQSVAADPDSQGASISSGRQNKTASYSGSYTDVLDQLTTMVISNLDEAGIPANRMAASLKGVVRGFSGALTRSGVTTTRMPSVLETITTAAVGSCHFIGIDDDRFDTALDAILEGTFSGLGDTGMRETDIADLAGNVTLGAILGLKRSQVPATQYETKIAVIIAGIKAGMRASGISQGEVDRVEVRISQSALNGRIDLISDSTSDQITATHPENRSVDIPTHTAISIRLATAMDADTINSSSFFLSDGSSPLAGSITYNSLNQTASFTPAAMLKSLSSYLATATTSVRDSSGINLVNPYQFSFRTASNILELGSYHGCLLSGSGQARCWGDNGDGELGQEGTAKIGDDETLGSLGAISLGSNRTAVRISAGDTFTCAVLDTGAIKCWGVNTYGQLGLGDTTSRGNTASSMGDNLPAVDLGTGRTGIDVSVGSRFACAILDNRDIKCWGCGIDGRLGTGDEVNHGDEAGEMGDSLGAVSLGTGRTPIQIVAGRYHACVLFKDGNVKCWGNNANGQLGIGDTTNRGDGMGLMGDNLPVVDLGTGRTAVEIAAGNYYNCARLDNNSVKCWGRNDYGQLGLGDGINRGDNAHEMGDNLPFVNLGTGRSALEIDTGASHTCARLDDGSVKCWGYRLNGRLGYYPLDTRIGDSADEMGDNLPTVDLGTGRKALEISVGNSYTCTRLDNNSIKCWGNNTYGQLGLGDTAHRGDQTGEMGDSLPAVDIPLD
ncbi:MAG: Ig-like domain-containing protein [bacterium]